MSHVVKRRVNNIKGLVNETFMSLHKCFSVMAEYALRTFFQKILKIN